MLSERGRALFLSRIQGKRVTQREIESSISLSGRERNGVIFLRASKRERALLWRDRESSDTQSERERERSIISSRRRGDRKGAKVYNLFETESERALVL